jgi:coproporphyrinogen III oxidase-like Fe-S oxidoreductase
MLRLRTRAGLPASALVSDRGPALRWAIDHGLVERAGDVLALTLRGRLLSNEVFARLV